MLGRDRAQFLATLTAYRRPAPPPGRIAAWLIASGLRVVATPGGWSYADCPACSTFAALTIDADGCHWRSACGCYGRHRLGEPEAVALFHARAGHAA